MTATRLTPVQVSAVIASARGTGVPIALDRYALLALAEFVRAHVDAQDALAERAGGARFADLVAAADQADHDLRRAVGRDHHSLIAALRESGEGPEGDPNWQAKVWGSVAPWYTRFWRRIRPRPRGRR